MNWTAGFKREKQRNTEFYRGCLWLLPLPRHTQQGCREGIKKLATGQLTTVDNQVDTSTGTVKLRAQFDNTDFALFPNQFVNVHLTVDTLSDTTIVATSA